MSQHTPGPWITDGAWVKHADDDIPAIATCNLHAWDQGDRTYQETCANARLIAASPDLLEFAQWVASLKTGGRIEGRARAVVDLAIGAPT